MVLSQSIKPPPGLSPNENNQKAAFNPPTRSNFNKNSNKSKGAGKNGHQNKKNYNDSKNSSKTMSTMSSSETTASSIITLANDNFITNSNSNNSSSNNVVSEQTTLCLKNLSNRTCIKDVGAALEKFGLKASKLELHYNGTGEFKGTAFAKFKTKEEAAHAQKTLGGILELSGRKVKVEMRKKSKKSGVLPARDCLAGELNCAQVSQVKEAVAVFLADDSQTSLQFPGDFSATMRKYIHSLAETHNLSHTTTTVDGCSLKDVTRKESQERKRFNMQRCVVLRKGRNSGTSHKNECENSTNSGTTVKRISSLESVDERVELLSPLDKKSGIVNNNDQKIVFENQHNPLNFHMREMAKLSRQQVPRTSSDHTSPPSTTASLSTFASSQHSVSGLSTPMTGNASAKHLNCGSPQQYFCEQDFNTSSVHRRDSSESSQNHLHKTSSINSRSARLPSYNELLRDTVLYGVGNVSDDAYYASHHGRRPQEQMNVPRNYGGARENHLSLPQNFDQFYYETQKLKMSQGHNYHESHYAQVSPAGLGPAPGPARLPHVVDPYAVELAGYEYGTGPFVDSLSSQRWGMFQ